MRARSALAAAAAAAAVLATTGVWAHTTLHRQQVGATHAQAESQMERVLDQLYRGALPGGFGPLPYEVVISGRSASGGASSDLDELGSRQRHLLPAPTRWDPWTIRTVHLPHPPGTPRTALTGRTVQALTADIQARDLGHDKAVSMAIADDGLLRVYVLLTSPEADHVMESADRVVLMTGVVGVVLVAVAAHTATRLALRSVKAIRTRTAQVTARQPRERVDVPDTRDEIAALARTINATLERLDAAATLQQRFVADAAHELRSPLTTLLTSLEVALAYPDRTDWPTAVATAARHTRRLRSLTEDLLLLARLDADAPGTAATSVDLSALAQRLAHEREQAEGHPDVRPDTPGPAFVSGRPQELERLLRNLLDNAVRHATHSVRLTVRVEGDRVVTSVCDDGPGVPAADTERIFERFTRLDDHRARTSGGTGLGLAIARELAHRHSGTLRGRLIW
ncbi:HAMP domain-containing histidine kinase (plasmid) [Streptomyces sp. NBC_01450]|uniref:sensor histidine kinase n=1 Tax=Streptomyces sp. NBC_01450 TaxID=2903871 RepID=UPI002E301830|nr:ATP-binding protein [Streptomyces sp. NBC_01450]